MILAIRTDRPIAELELYDGLRKLDTYSWEAHRQLAETLHRTLDSILAKNNRKISDISGVVCFRGPGSFTGLRIGLSVANAISYSNSIPIVSTTGDNWALDGLERLNEGDNEIVALPEYGIDAVVTLPKK